MNNISKIAALGFLTFSLSCAYAQGPQDIFKSNKQKAKLEKNAPSLRYHLTERKKALEAWNAIPASELQPVTLTANVTAKNRYLFKDTQTFEHRIVRGSFKRLL